MLRAASPPLEGRRPVQGSAISYASLTARGLVPNRWDCIAFPLVFGLLLLAAKGAHETLAPLSALKEPVVSLDPLNLPEYALRTTLRMLAAMVASLLFTLTYGTLAAKSRRAELVLIPLLDILQSVPVLGYISFTVVFFMSLFPGRVAGAEAAAIFAIFTSQAWNMSFTFYQSLRTVPRDLEEATYSFRFSTWQRIILYDQLMFRPLVAWADKFRFEQ